MASKTRKEPSPESAGREVLGHIESIDAEGNLVSDITAEMLAGAPTDERLIVRCDEHETMGLFPSADGQPQMTFLAILGADGRLRLSIVGDSAAAMLGIRKGETVSVRW